MLKPLLAALVLAMTTMTAAAADKSHLVLELKSGEVKIELLEDVAPRHVARVKALTAAGAYDGIAFHRVIDRFMAQTGDVQYGKVTEDGTVSARAGTGASNMPDLPAEFSTVPFERGIVGAARSTDPNSANSQFFIMFEREPYGRGLDNNYTVWGRVVDGIEHIDNIKRGDPQSGRIDGTPDKIISARIE